MKYIITESQLFEIVHNTINKVFLSESNQNKQYKELLLEGDDRLKKVKRIIQQSFKGTALNTDSPVSSAEYYVGNKGANTTWMDYLLYSVRHTFGLMENKDLPLLVKVAKIAFDELEFEKTENHIDELNTLKTIVRLLKKDADAANRVIKDSNVTYEKLYNEYADALKQLKNDMRYKVNSKKYQKNQRYEIIPIDDFRTANELGKYTGTGNGSGALCYTQGKGTWDGYTSGGVNQCYLCYTTDFKDIEPRVTEGYPKDEYGLSMIWLFVNSDGELTNSNVRWNHGYQDFKDVDNIFTAEEISDIVGVNFYETFRPNDKWAKTVEEALYRFKNGEDPHKVFDDCYEFSNGFARVRLNGKWNFINTNGELLSPNKWFDLCWDFNEGFTEVRVGDKWNYINTNGELLSPNQWFDQCFEFKEGFAVVELDNSLYFINTDGNIANDAVQQMLARGISLNDIFDECNSFEEGFAAVELNNKWNYINTNGELVSPNQWFDYCNSFKEGFARIFVDIKFNYINANGEILSPNMWFDGCFDFNEGFARVELDEKWNFINTNGELVSPNKWFDECYEFSNGFAAVRSNCLWNYINTNGELLNPNEWFDGCDDFSEGFAVVQVDDKCNFIDTNGDYLSNTWFDWCEYFVDGIANVELDEQNYTIDTKGQLYNEYGDPVNSPLQENRRYGRNKKQIIRITESQLRNAISNVINHSQLMNN